MEYKLNCYFFQREKYLLIFTGFLFFFIFFSNNALAQTVKLTPASVSVEANSSFSLDLNVNSVTNLFGIGFDLSFNPELIQFVSASEGPFLTQGCQAPILITENPPGNLIVGMTRLGPNCGGVSGSGKVATFKFRSLDKGGSMNFSFPKTHICSFKPPFGCEEITATWVPAKVVVNSTSSDTTPPVLLNAYPIDTLPSGTTQTKISISTNEPAICKYDLLSGISYEAMSNTFSTTGSIGHSTTVSGLSDNNSYVYYVRCKDNAGNVNTNDFPISFSVAGAVAGIDNVIFNVDLEGKSNTEKIPVTIEIIDTINNSMAAKFTNEPKNKAIAKLLLPIAENAYHIRVLAPGYLAAKQNTVLIKSGANITLPTLLAGDFNADNIINSIDWGIMNANWFKAHNMADINQDGIVNSIDFSYMNKNWFKSGA